MAKKQPSCFRKIDADKNQNLLDNFDKKYLQGAAVGLSPPFPTIVRGQFQCRTLYVTMNLQFCFFF